MLGGGLISDSVFSSGSLVGVEGVEGRLKAACFNVIDVVKLEGVEDEGEVGLQTGENDLATALSIREFARKSTDFLPPGGLFFSSPL